jgi:hypothetical protein
MRPVLLLSLLLGVAACDGGRSLGPESARVTIRLQDDRGVPVGRTQVIVTQPSGARLVGRSDDAGTADIAVAEGGVYRVQVIPREGYVGGTEALSKEVTVAANATVLVYFTVHRAGATGEPGFVYPTS